MARSKPNGSWKTARIRRVQCESSGKHCSLSVGFCSEKFGYVWIVATCCTCRFGREHAYHSWKIPEITGSHLLNRRLDADELSDLQLADLATRCNKYHKTYIACQIFCMLMGLQNQNIPLLDLGLAWASSMMSHVVLPVCRVVQQLVYGCVWTDLVSWPCGQLGQLRCLSG